MVGLSHYKDTHKKDHQFIVRALPLFDLFGITVPINIHVPLYKNEDMNKEMNK